MYFIKNDNLKIIFAFTHKCGSTHVVNLFYYLIYGFLTYNLSTYDTQILPTDIQNYKIFVFIRNPYKRLVSGFLHGITSKCFFGKRME